MIVCVPAYTADIVLFTDVKSF